MLKGVLALALLGTAIYFVVQAVQHGDRPRVRAPRLPERLRRPVAPDDDPRFLRELDEQVWLAKRQRQRASADDAATTQTTAPAPSPADPPVPPTPADQVSAAGDDPDTASGHSAGEEPGSDPAGHQSA